MGQKIDTPDIAVALIAGRQHGVATRRQLKDVGLGARAIRNRVDRGQLHRQHHVVVEVDSFTYHRGSVAFKADHARDLDLRGAGFTVLRFSDRQLEGEPGRVVADVQRALYREAL